MFESITIRGAESNTIDTGAFAEALLFYQNVHLLLDRGSLPTLANKIGIDNLRHLLGSGFCSATFQRDMTGVVSQQIGGTPIKEHGLIAFELGSKDKKKSSYAIRSTL